MASSTRHARPKTGHSSVTGALLLVAQFGIAQWLFGNIYEAVVRIPERLAVRNAETSAANATARPPSVLGAGSPVRYYAPAVPLTAAGLAAALLSDRQSRATTRWLVLSAASWTCGGAITAYLVKTINLKLFFTLEPPPTAERDELLRKWYRLNVVRIASAAIALLAAHRAREGCAFARRGSPVVRRYAHHKPAFAVGALCVMGADGERISRGTLAIPGTARFPSRRYRLRLCRDRKAKTEN